MVYKCKICGGKTTIDSNNGIAVCEYCGTKQALPLFTEDSERLLYESGNKYLSHSEYDKAENVFNQLLTIKPNAAELYWDLVLCKYGVTYVKDPETEKYIPTCNRTHYTPIYSDKNYLKAVELSTGEKKTLFEEDAKTIDNIQKGIIAVSKKEKPFDIFISYKETDVDGNRTKDSVEAQKLYEKLTEAGYKVFFSRITLEDRIGSEYEPYIYAALYSSKVMITICSSRENIEAVWVKNEWSRFLGFGQNDTSKTLLPLYFDMEKSELPDDFALLSSYDMSVVGFEEELLRGIKKLIPLPIMKAKRRKKIAKILGSVAACVALSIGIATAIVIPKEKEAQRVQAEKEATEKVYQDAMMLFGNAEYTAAAAAFAELGDYEDSAYMVKRCAIQPDYDAAMQLYYDGKYAQATWAFKALGDYEDSAEQKEKAELSWRKSLAVVSLNNIVDEDTYGAYYITPNGTVKNFPLETGSSHENIEIDKHGKVVSISNGKCLFALHEDGMLDNISQNGDIDEENWQNIVQTASFYFVTNVALKSDGKVLLGSISQEPFCDGWLADATNWKNIVMLDSGFEINGAGIGAYLVGVDVDGDAYLCSLSGSDGTHSNPFEIYSDAFKDIKNIDVSFDSFETMFLNVVALRDDGKMVTYINGELSVEDASNIVDIKLIYDTVYTLHSDGKLYSNKYKSAILSDVVAIFDEYLITRSGMIYTLEDTPESTGVKGGIYDEWIARME